MSVDSTYKDNPVRSQDPSYEIDTGFNAGLAMVNKRMGYDDIPLSTFNVWGYDFAYVGERQPIFTDVIVEGNLSTMQFIAYLFKGELTSKEVNKRTRKRKIDTKCVGILTWNIPRVHIYFREAMRLGGILPTMEKMQASQVKHKEICDMVISKNTKLLWKRDKFLE